MNFIDKKLDFKFLGIILISSLVFFLVDTGSSFKYAEPTTFSCVNRTLLSLISFGYNEPCCCSSDHQPFYYLIGKIWKALFGFSHTSFKILAFIFYQISVLTLYKFGEKFLKNKLLIFLFPLCFVFNYQFQELSNYVYMYIHYFLFISIAYSQLMFKEDVEEKDLVVFFGCLLIGSMFFYMTYIHLGIGFLLCIFTLKRKILTKKLISLGVISLLLFLFKTPVVFQHRMHNFAKGAYDYGTKSTFKDIFELLFGSQSLDPKVVIIYLLAFSAFGIGMVHYVKMKKSKFPLFMVCATSLASIVIYFYLRLRDYNEIKSEYFISLLLFFNIYVFIFLENTKKYIRSIFLILFFLALGWGVKKNLIWKKHEAYDPLLVEVNSFIANKPNLNIYFINNDTKLWLFGMYESVFEKRLNFKRLDHQNLNCPKDSNFYFFESFSRDFKVNEDFKIKCLSNYKRINYRKLKIQSYPNFWTLLELEKK